MSIMHQLPKSTRRPAKRIGRGIGSGKGGHTSSRGQKGQRSRAGGAIPIWFEGGQLPLIKRLPMLRGKAKFEPTSRIASFSLTEIQRLTVASISLETLRVAGALPRGAREAKIIATGTLTKPVTVTGLRVTAAARAAIEAAGGRVE